MADVFRHIHKGKVLQGRVQFPTGGEAVRGSLADESATRVGG